MVLKTENIVKDFGLLRAVNRVSLTIEEGEIRAIIGPNGAGKSTLFDLITNRTKLDFGKIIFNNCDITNLPPYNIASKGLGKCFQISKLFPQLTAFENVQIAATCKHEKCYKMFSSGRYILKDEVSEVLDSVGLYERKGELAGYLSYGDQRRLEIAITLATRPTLLLLDEPTAGVSPGEGQDLMRLITGLRHKHALTIVFIEHDMKMVFNFADTITVMHLGCIVKTGNPSDIKSDSLVRRTYLGEISE